MSRELKVTKVSSTTASVSSMRWADNPDISIILAFAQDLKDAVDAGYLSPSDKVKVRENEMTVYKITTDDKVEIDVRAEADTARLMGTDLKQVMARVKAKAPSPASAIVRSADADEDRYAEMGSE